LPTWETWPRLGVRESVPEEVTLNFYLKQKDWLGERGNFVTRGSTIEGLALLQSAPDSVRQTQDKSINPTKPNSNNIFLWWCISKITFIHEGLYFWSPDPARFESKNMHLSYIWKALSFNILTSAKAKFIFATIFLWSHKPQRHFVFGK
jgi:hypothetical protein